MTERLFDPDSERQRFRDLEEMFGTRGWKHVVKDAQKQIYEYQAMALEAKSWDEVNKLRGRAEQLNEIVMLEEITDSLLEDFEERLQEAENAPV